MSELTTDRPTDTDDLLALDARAQRLLFTEARTANTFSEEPVSDEQLRAIVELAKWPPTAANINPLRILFVNSPEARARLVSHMSEGNAPKTATAPAVAVLAADTEFHEHVPRLLPFRPELKDYFAADDALRERQATFNAALQAAYFILAIRAAGLAAGPMGGFDGPGIDREFFADRPWRSILVVNIGRPGVNPWFDRLPRLDYDEMVQHI
jgi:3-hydroxypropanoate dehydrogenase